MEIQPQSTLVCLLSDTWPAEAIQGKDQMMSLLPGLVYYWNLINYRIQCVF